MDSFREDCESEAHADVAEHPTCDTSGVEFPRLSRAALRQFEASRRLTSRGVPRVAAVLMSGEKVGWCIKDQAVEHRFTFRGNLTVAELLQDGVIFCKEANLATSMAEDWYELMPDFRPTGVVFANQRRATMNDELWNGPGPITLVQ